jgi:hypothetical protein
MEWTVLILGIGFLMAAMLLILLDKQDQKQYVMTLLAQGVNFVGLGMGLKSGALKVRTGDNDA